MRATVVIPTLHGGESLSRCLRALEAQTIDDFEVIVVDNSDAGAASEATSSARVRVISNEENVGFGAAINQGMAETDAEFVCALNDDACPSPAWLESLVEAAESGPNIGMCASLILLADESGDVDSAGLGIYPDCTTKQIGHGQPRSSHATQQDVLIPSGCAALYRREMLQAIGGFDADYFLYGEDSDVGLRGRLAGWRCVFEPRAVVTHDYSGSAGRASRLKAFYVERNRLLTLFKLLPLGVIMASPLYALGRYWAHWRAASKGDGLAGEFGIRESSLQLVLIVMQAHASALLRLPTVWSQRRRFHAHRRLSNSEFRTLMNEHHLTAREIAGQ